MANLDTTSKRRSSVSLFSGWLLAPPLPDGTVDQGDRQHIGLSYSGVLASGAVIPVDTGQGGGKGRKRKARALEDVYKIIEGPVVEATLVDEWAELLALRMI